MTTTTKNFRLGVDRLTSQILVSLSRVENPAVEVCAKAWDRCKKYRQIVQAKLNSGEIVYGLNTGFGYLSDVNIERDQLEKLQINLVRSHACGVGEFAAPEYVRALLILRAHTFLIGHSGVSPQVVEQICSFLKNDILPMIPLQGSVGASGDLAPLSHLALAFIGEGQVLFRGEVLPTSKVLADLSIEPLKLQAKDGLCLINGTHLMTVLGGFAVEKADTLAKTSDVAIALSLDAIRGSLAAFSAEICSIRQHPGQNIVSENVRGLFADSDAIMESHKDCGKVQDPYSFRCSPQVHGASRDAIDYVRKVIDTELNSVTDNPLVFAANDENEALILSGGNFHGQPIAIAMDFLAIALSELGSISERRIEKITNPALSGLPPFAMQESGLNSGFMMPHVTSAALASENKSLCFPASVDNIPTSADKEDHVSMGPIAARKALNICGNLEKILAIELLTAAQGIDLLHPLVPCNLLKSLHDGIRELSPTLEEDRVLSTEITEVAEWVRQKGPLQLLEARGFCLH